MKHWPGSGPHKDGKGSWLVYPGDNLDYQLRPWKKGIELGAHGGHGLLQRDLCGCFQCVLLAPLVRESSTTSSGFKGAICTDWGVVGHASDP
ncbi:MAG: hypothetical protein R2751_10315 [Bacteroidales bacterium]